MAPSASRMLSVTCKLSAQVQIVIGFLCLQL